MARAVISKEWKPRTTLTLAALHFLVDGLCVCCLFQMVGLLGLVHSAGIFITYNVVAFLTQPFTGMLADRLKFSDSLLAACVMLLSSGVVVASVLAAGMWPGGLWGCWLTALLLGFGNSLFHVWGGRLLAVDTANDARSLGVFVSAGVLGLTIGILYHCQLMTFGYLGLITLLSMGLAVRKNVVVDVIGRRTDSSRVKRPLSPALAWQLVLSLMVFVMLRSSAAEAFSVSLGRGETMVLAVGVVAMLGKISGGWLTRWLGGGQSLALLVMGTIICFGLSRSYDGWLWAGLFLVNCTMPVTLWLANRSLPGSEGLAFGLLAAALMPGYLFAHSGFSDHGIIILMLLALLVPTVLIELVVLWQLRERRPEVLWSSVVLNVLTNVPLNLFLLYGVSTWVTIIVGEVAVVVVEALWYRYFVGSWQRAFVYSFLCNGISYLSGLLVLLSLLLILTL